MHEEFEGSQAASLENDPADHRLRPSYPGAGLVVAPMVFCCSKVRHGRSLAHRDLVLWLFGWGCRLSRKLPKIGVPVLQNVPAIKGSLSSGPRTPMSHDRYTVSPRNSYPCQECGAYSLVKANLGRRRSYPCSLPAVSTTRLTNKIVRQ